MKLVEPQELSQSVSLPRSYCAWILGALRVSVESAVLNIGTDGRLDDPSGNVSDACFR